MVVIKRSLALILVFVVTISIIGCTVPENSADFPSPKMTNSPFDNLIEADKKLLQQATAAGLIEIYYQAIINRNYNLALACRKLSLGLEDEFKSFWDGYISVQNLQIHIPENYTEEEIEMPQTPNQLILKVEYDVIRDERKQFTESTGQSVYLITLYRTSPEERWQISGLGEA